MDLGSDFYMISGAVGATISSNNEMSISSSGLTTVINGESCNVTINVRARPLINDYTAEGCITVCDETYWLGGYENSFNIPLCIASSYEDYASLFNGSGSYTAVPESMASKDDDNRVLISGFSGSDKSWGYDFVTDLALNYAGISESELSSVFRDLCSAGASSTVSGTDLCERLSGFGVAQSCDSDGELRTKCNGSGGSWMSADNEDEAKARCESLHSQELCNAVTMQIQGKPDATNCLWVPDGNDHKCMFYESNCIGGGNN